jgi:hypothetical protein
LTVALIATWAAAHHARTGHWPTLSSGPVVDAPPGEHWRHLDLALRLGRRGLPGNSSLALMVNQGRGRRATTERRQRAAALRAEGLTLAQIGQRLGISRQAVHQLLNGGPAPLSAPGQPRRAGGE